MLHPYKSIRKFEFKNEEVFIERYNITTGINSLILNFCLDKFWFALVKEAKIVLIIH